MAIPPLSIFQTLCKTLFRIPYPQPWTQILIPTLLDMSLLPTGTSHLGLDPWFHLPGYSLGFFSSVFLVFHFLGALSCLWSLQINIISSVFRPWELNVLLCPVVDDGASSGLLWHKQKLNPARVLCYHQSGGRWLQVAGPEETDSLGKC